MKHYTDIERFKEKYADVFKIGEWVTITEKVDGSNASFTFDADADKVAAFSRRNQLNECNSLNGFWEFTQRLNKGQIDMLTQGGRYLPFGEWLTKHTVRYPDYRYKNFYMFDVWDNETEQYLPHEDTYALFKGLEKAAQLSGEILYFVPILYEGPFKGWDHIYELVGTSQLGAEPCGEGVVIKSQDRLGDKNSRTPAYLKVVSEQFSEIHSSHVKTVDPEALKKREAERAYIGAIATERRAEKCLQKLIEDGIVPEDWDEKSMGLIAKNLPKAVYEDCLKEEKEFVLACENFGKVCGSLTMGYAKEWLKGR